MFSASLAVRQAITATTNNLVSWNLTTRHCCLSVNSWSRVQCRAAHTRLVPDRQSLQLAYKGKASRHEAEGA